MESGDIGSEGVDRGSVLNGRGAICDVAVSLPLAGILYRPISDPFIRDEYRCDRDLYTLAAVLSTN
jgi:hypothetical protein